MNERPESPPELPLEPPPEPAAPPRRDVAPLFYAAGFLLLAGATGYVWWAAPPPAGSAQLPDLTAVEQQLQRLDARLTQLEQRPRPAAADIGPVQSRIAALEQKPAADTGVAARLDARLDALTGRLDGLSERTQSADTEPPKVGTFVVWYQLALPCCCASPLPALSENFILPCDAFMAVSMNVGSSPTVIVGLHCGLQA